MYVVPPFLDVSHLFDTLREGYLQAPKPMLDGPLMRAVLQDRNPYLILLADHPGQVPRNNLTCW